jgi:hypothetical protein
VITDLGTVSGVRVTLRYHKRRGVLAVCWRAEGCPSQPEQSASFAGEQQIRERMAARGGEDRYRVRAGRT